MLVPHAHQTSQTAHASKGPIFVRERITPPTEFRNEVPAQLKARLISLRAYAKDGMMLDADVVDGRDLDPLIDRLLAEESAGRCKKDSWWRLLHKRWRPKRLENPLDKGERWNRWVRA